MATLRSDGDQAGTSRKAELLRRGAIELLRSRALVLIGLMGILAAIGWRTERMFDVTSVARVGIVLCLFVSLTAVVWFGLRRVVAAAVAAFAVLALLGILSKLKFNYNGATLHMLDLYLHLGSPVEVAFFAWHQPLVAAGGLAAVGVVAALIAMLARREVASGWSRLAAVPVMALPLLPASHYAASPRLQEQMLHGHFYDGYHLTSWFLSAFVPIDSRALARHFPGTPPAEHKPAVALRFGAAADAAIAAPSAVATQQAGPNIILILHESTIDPRPYRPAEVARFKEDPFVSGDGRTRKLIVETFGGRTWITEYGLMFGLSTHYFQPNQAFLGYLLEGKMRHSLGHALSNHGYGSTYVYPAPRTFANTGRFYRSLGFERVIDYHDQAKPAYNKRDRDHYQTAFEDLKARRAAGDRRPVLSFVMTEATHFPWSTAYFPDVRADEIVPGDAFAEYARRIRIGHDDYTAFKAALAAAFPGERFLLVGFGDHHPNLTAPAIADTNPVTSPRYETFYRIEGLNFTPDYASAESGIEIGYLGTVIQQAARLGLDPSYALRRDTKTACAGLMHRCQDQSRIKALHRALVERGDFEPYYDLSR
jgi:phosphoglycerol transferase MdoB-like AlkP superfamily enzyme